MTRDEIIRQKVEEAKRLLEEISSLVSEETQSESYNTDLDFYGDTDLDNIWSDLNTLSETVDEKIQYDQQFPWKD